MKISIPKEILPGETRVAVIPDTVKKLVAKGHEVTIESGAGLPGYYENSEYEKAGGKIESSVETLLGSAEVVLKVQKPMQNEKVGKHELDMMKEGSILISFLFPHSNPDLIKRLIAKKISCFAMEAIPRTTLAQSMDVLSSMGTVAGYKSVLVAAMTLGKFFPMFMTAAGTIAPAKVLIIGAGVAGLQAVATARRLGAVVEVFDTRTIVKDQVKSLGAKFVEVASDEDAQTASGYAKELSEDYKKKQADLIKKHLAKSDICITTAQIPGKKAPLIIPKDMVEGMKPGSVIVDLAAEQGGNCEVTEAGKEVDYKGVKVVGLANIPSTMPTHASQMYSKNIEKFIMYLSDDKAFKFDMNDEITKGSIITHQGEITQEAVKQAMG